MVYDFNISKNLFTVKAFVVIPKMTKEFIVFRGGYDKDYTIFYSRWKFICFYPKLFQ